VQSKLTGFSQTCSKPEVGKDLLASSFFDYEAFEASPLTRDPFAFVVVPNFVKAEAFKDIIADFPNVPGPGSFPPESLALGGAFRTLLDELEGARFQQAIERKFEIDLTGRPKMLTIRGHARRKDGAAHRDSATKLISVLLYLNEDWKDGGGRLRLLRSANLNEAVAEIAPIGGTLVAFRRSEFSWHGHEPHIGQRRAIQFNWLTENEVAAWQRGRHLATAAFKKIYRFFSL
jgi:SM-20-related protein